MFPPLNTSSTPIFCACKRINRRTLTQFTAPRFRGGHFTWTYPRGPVHADILRHTRTTLDGHALLIHRSGTNHIVRVKREDPTRYQGRPSASPDARISGKIEQIQSFVVSRALVIESNKDNPGSKNPLHAAAGANARCNPRLHNIRPGLGR